MRDITKLIYESTRKIESLYPGKFKLFPNPQDETFLVHARKAVWNILEYAQHIEKHGITVHEIWQGTYKSPAKDVIITPRAYIYTESELRAVNVLSGSIALSPLNLRVIEVGLFPQNPTAIHQNLSSEYDPRSGSRTFEEMEYKFKKKYGENKSPSYAIMRGYDQPSNARVDISIGNYDELHQTPTLKQRIIAQFKKPEYVKIW